MSKPPAARGGRPPTRRRLALSWWAWRMVREEILRRRDGNVSAACEAILARRGWLKVGGPPGKGFVLWDPGTLRQWYAQAERDRETNDELAAWCDAWEDQAAARWPDMLASIAAARALASSVASGLNLARDVQAIDAACRAAADQARETPSEMPKPRRNRR